MWITSINIILSRYKFLRFQKSHRLFILLRSVRRPLRLRHVVVFIFLIIVLTSLEEATRSHTTNWNSTNLPKLSHGLVSVVLLYHLGVVFWMLDFDMLVQTAFRSITFWAIVDWTLVMSCNFSSSPSVPLFLLVVDLERHTKDFFMLSFVWL